jgi:uncharacterized membrane protein
MGNLYDIPHRRQAFYLSFLVLLFLFSCSEQSVYPAPPVQGSEVIIDATVLRSEIPKFFTFHYRGKNINFFVLKTHDKVLSFLDACMSCYPSKKGFSVEGGYIRCRACNVRYSLSEIDKGFGGCSPIQIQGHLENGKYHISISRLEKSADRF